MINRETYEAKISVATPVQLVVINFELIIDALNEAIASWETDDADRNVFRGHIKQAINCIHLLIQGLNYDVPMSHDFNELYRYSYKALNDSYFRPNLQVVKEILEIMNNLIIGWQGIATPKKPPKLEAPTNNKGGRPQVFAGLTYGRDGGLVEYSIDSGNEFKA